MSGNKIISFSLGFDVLNNICKLTSIRFNWFEEILNGLLASSGMWIRSRQLVLLLLLYMHHACILRRKHSLLWIECEVEWKGIDRCRHLDSIDDSVFHLIDFDIRENENPTDIYRIVQLMVLCFLLLNDRSNSIKVCRWKSIAILRITSCICRHFRYLCLYCICCCGCCCCCGCYCYCWFSNSSILSKFLVQRSVFFRNTIRLFLTFRSCSMRTARVLLLRSLFEWL